MVVDWNRQKMKGGREGIMVGDRQEGRGGQMHTGRHLAAFGFGNFEDLK